jgi:hypothetical protein
VIVEEPLVIKFLISPQARPQVFIVKKVGKVAGQQE